MDLWTIIPVKPFGLGKSRLAPVLSAPERAALNRAMFEHVLRTAIAAFGAATHRRRHGRRGGRVTRRAA